jgi:dihydrofolate synthase / folylpolyglutamate synthase
MAQTLPVTSSLAQLLDDLNRLHPREIDLSLERLLKLLAKLGDPHKKLPPVFHVAGTNGKGSTVAFLRSCLEAAGKRVHVYTSPHLVRFNERIRLAGQLIDDATLEATLHDVAAINAGDPITVFEITTAVAFLAFSRVAADACILEVGMGGRLDATNVITDPVVCGISQLGLDHQHYLGNSILDIAAEKAGIAKRGCPLVISRYPKSVTARIAECAGVAGARIFIRNQDWDVSDYQGAVHFKDAQGRVETNLPKLFGSHQIENAGLAIAMLRHQSAVPVSDAALKAGIGWAKWPARMQKITDGALLKTLPKNADLWLDGGHNPLAGRVLSDTLRTLEGSKERPIYLIVGMLTTKDAAGFLKPFAGHIAGVYGVPIAHHDCYAPSDLKEIADGAGLAGLFAHDVKDALKAIAKRSDKVAPPIVLICGSLYLAGEVLALSGFTPE